MKKDGEQARPDDRWLQAASRLPREIHPERDLWPDIEARLHSEASTRRRRRSWRLAATAAAAVVLVAMSSLITLWVTDRPENLPVSRVQTPAGVARPAGGIAPDATVTAILVPGTALAALSVFLGYRGNAMIARRYLARGYQFARPQSVEARLAAQRWGLMG